jgi:2-amino-4-hydroxy-6-hydroxymethyldihydropteridine diphosphokinase
MTSEGTVAYVGVGSNLGDKALNCRCAIERMNRLPTCHVQALSGLFRTEPQGVTGQDWFINCVTQLTTTLSPFQLLEALSIIEYTMGRRRKKRWDARIIDLDILLFGQQIIRSQDLIIPHPLLHKRRFVLKPLAQLAPDLVHPILNVPIRGLLSKLPERPSVEPLQEVAKCSTDTAGLEKITRP